MANLDAVIVGSGPNGLAAAVTLTAAGLKVLVVEGAASPGGGCRTAELTLPGFWHDVCATAHPLGAASPFFRQFDLAARDVRFAYPDVQFAHPLEAGPAALVTRSVADTAAGLGPDARAYQRLFGPLASGVAPGAVMAGAPGVAPRADTAGAPGVAPRADTAGAPGVAPRADTAGASTANALTDLLLSPVRLPPARYPRGLATFAVHGLRGASALAGQFRTPQARALVAGAAAHAMMPLSAPLTSATALILITLAHTAGWPFVRGGSARITDALLGAVVAGGGQIETGRWVRSLADLPTAKAVLLDVTPRGLAGLAGDRLPAGYLRRLHQFRYGPGVCKVDFALSGPVPWSDKGCLAAGTLHLGGTFEQIAAAEADVAAGRHPASPYVLVGQPGIVDPTRAPAGQQTLWTYCHVPSGSDIDMSAAIEAQIERFAPGFRDLVLARAVRTAADLQADNPNYVGGDIGAGLQALRQRLLGPVPRWNPYRTPARGVYLCSSSVPPMPGVHGRCGELAALTALRDVFGVRDMPGLSPGAAEPANRARSRP